MYLIQSHNAPYAPGSLYGLAQDNGGDTTAQDIKDAKNIGDFFVDVWNSIKGLFNWGPKTVGYLQKDEVEQILKHPKVFRYGFMSPGCSFSHPVQACPGSFWSDSPYRAADRNFWKEMFPFHWTDMPRMGNWYYQNFGFRHSAFEPGLSNGKYPFIAFDPKTLLPVDGEGVALPGGRLYDTQYHMSPAQLMDIWVSRGIFPNREEGFKILKDYILKNWQHKDNPANAGAVLDQETGDVIDPETGDVVIPEDGGIPIFTDVARELGGVGGLLLFGVGTYIAVKSFQNTQKPRRRRR